jgi:hypothetical protein
VQAILSSASATPGICFSDPKRRGRKARAGTQKSTRSHEQHAKIPLFTIAAVFHICERTPFTSPALRCSRQQDCGEGLVSLLTWGPPVHQSIHPHFLTSMIARSCPSDILRDHPQSPSGENNRSRRYTSHFSRGTLPVEARHSMRLGDSDCFIDLALRESVASNMPGAGDLRIRVTLRGSGFTGVQEDVWIAHSAAERFVDDLHAMVDGKGDEAVLESAISGELNLRFSRPMPSHVLVECKLKRIGARSPATISASVAFAIYIVRADVRNIAEALTEAWAPPAHARTH